MSDSDRYAITIGVMVEHGAMLWDAAAARAVLRMNAGDIPDTIGPREDPNIGDCLAMLLDPSWLPGCTPLWFDIAIGRQRPSERAPPWHDTHPM